jgi:hypothetical protein
MDYQQLVITHYESVFREPARIYLFDKGPFEKLPADFRILEFPAGENNMWKYATCCMSQPVDEDKIELHMFSDKQDNSLIELLTVVAYYHRLKARLGLHHTVNFGRPWQGNAGCDRGLISQPYIYGPSLENLTIFGQNIKCYWLLPIWESEVNFKIKNGAAALEEQFDKRGLNYLNPNRENVL